MQARQWTNEQNDAINARGGTVLVSAAAGSGKTAVLVERVIGLITDKNHPCDADRLLVVTFTNAAAAEMRERIAKRVADLIEENPSDENLQRQQMLLQNSHISTIHSFCLDLLRENFEKLDIPSDFRIADSNDDDILRNDVLADILEKRYGEAVKNNRTKKNDPFLSLSFTLSSGRDDKLLSQTILKLYNFTRSLHNSSAWLDEMSEMYNGKTPAAETVWGKAALLYVKEALNSASMSLKHGLELMAGDDKMQSAYEPAFESDIEMYGAVSDLCLHGSWNDVYNAVNNLSFARLGPLSKYPDENFKKTVKGIRDDAKKDIQSLCEGVMSFSEEQVDDDIRRLRPAAECLCSIVRELDTTFFKEKLRRGMLDFSDLEQLTLKLLVDESGKTPKLTETAAEIATHFDEVLVDEYQDTNPAQDMIFRAVSQNAQNLFMVGDVKQSIYSFRQARPEIFTENAKKCLPYGKGFPARIILGKNFRSRKGVTDAVNFIFTRLMSQEYGGVDYGETERLIPGADYFETDESGFELHVINGENYETRDAKIDIEARHIAKTIKKMIASGYTVEDKGGPRKATYRDFAILLRSMKGRAESFTGALEAEGIPCYANIDSGYLAAYEVTVMISFLRILDNPLDEVPLLSVLLSPLFGFTPDDVAEVRIFSKKANLYLAMTEFSKSGNTKFDEFLKLTEKLRSLAAVLSTDRLILKIYDETGLMNIFEAMPNGAMRRANLRLLLNYARSYESAGWRGLSGFVRFIDHVTAQKSDLSPASGISENADVVKVMSIHKSKGLEFPVCFLANLSKGYNLQDTHDAALFNPDCGFGSVVRNDDKGFRYTTLPREAVKLQVVKSTYSEELRVLYVAMTRAKEKLIAVMTFDNLARPLANAAAIARDEGAKAATYSEMKAKNPAELILSAALLHPSCGSLRSLCSFDGGFIEESGEPWTVKIIDAQRLIKEEKTEKAEETAEVSPEETQLLKEKIKEKLSYIYPYEHFSDIPANVSVTELSHHETSEFDANTVRPAFLEKEKLTSAEKGTALHAFMQLCSLDEILLPSGVEREIERLVKDKFILPEQGEAVDPQKVRAFAASELFARVRLAKVVYREFKFNIEVPAKELFPQASDSDAPVLLRGMADLVFKDQTGVYIVDYKTDKVGKLSVLRERYSSQLAWYTRAVEKILGEKVRDCYIYSFALGEALKL